MISKEFHASRRKQYQEFLQDYSIAFVFAGEPKEDRGDQMYDFTI